jgi:type I restriction enzyme S subunit
MYYKNSNMISGQGIGLQGLSSKRLHSIIVPLPSEDEQPLIVDKIDAVFSILASIDDLQTRYAADRDVLKGKLIDAAICGKLTNQLPEDGTAEDLYQQIQEEKKRLEKEGKIKKSKKLPEITEDEIPFDIPANWKWARWGNLSESIQYGYNAPAKAEGRIKMVRISDIQDNKVMWNTVPYCDIEEEDIENYLLHENDILFARTGGTVGKSYIVTDIPEDSIYAGYLIRTSYSSSLCPKYMKHFMESKLYWKQLSNGTIATAQPNCNGQTLSKMILPLPPLNEQERIVNRLDSLLDNLTE